MNMDQTWTILGDWSFSFGRKVFMVPPPAVLAVIGEYYWSLPLYQRGGGWNDGVALHGVAASNCAHADALIPASVEVRLNDVVMERGRDYDFNERWGTLGRLVGGRISADTGVFIDYTYIPMRLDSLVEDTLGAWHYRCGVPASTGLRPPALAVGERRLLNVYLEASIQTLQPCCFFPILETEYTWPSTIAMQEHLPQSLNKLRQGGPLRILAWGDSVTEAAYLPRAARWQEQMLVRLQRLYPQATLELLTHGWAGHSILSYLQAPPDSPHAFQSAVLGCGADLVISEFVNDAHLPAERWGEYFPQVLESFRRCGCEWLILTPHYVRPDWMGLSAQNGLEVENDPRPFVQFVRQFAFDNGIAVADAARRYGRLWRRGIPYNTLMTNAINHPDGLGMRLYADAILALFGEERIDDLSI